MRLLHVIIAMCISTSMTSAADAQRDCAGEFMQLRRVADWKALKAATARQPAICAAHQNVAAALAKVAEYAEIHGAECRIAPEALRMMKDNHTAASRIVNEVCDASYRSAPELPRHTNSDELRCTSQLKGTWVCGQ